MTTATARDPWVACFSTGWHGGRGWRKSDLARLVENYSLLRTRDAGVLPPIRVGHAPHLTDAEVVSQLASGHISALKMDESGTRVLARLSQVPEDVKDLVREGKLFRVSAEVIPQIERSSIAKNLGERGRSARGPAVIGLALLGSQRPECVDLPALTPDTFNEDTGTMTLNFNANELSGDAEPKLTDGALSVLHHVSGVRHNAKHAADHINQLVSHADDLADLLDVPDEPTPPPRPLTATERVTHMERQLGELRLRNTAMEVALSTDTAKPKQSPAKLVTFTAFDGAVADQVGQLAHLFLADLESELQRQGLDRDNVDVRRRVARELLLGPWKSSPPSASLPAAPSLADQLDPEDFRHAVEDFVPSASAKSSFTVQDTGEAFDRSSPTGSLEARFAQQVGQTMAQHGWDPSNTQLRRQAAREVMDQWARESADSAYGDADNLAAQLPEAAFERVVYGRALAADRPVHDQQGRGVVGMAEHHRGFAETPRTPQRAAVYGTAAMRSDADALWMAEGDTPEPPAYGTKGMAQPVEDARAVAFRECANEILKGLDPLDPNRVGVAWRLAASKYPTLTPDWSPYSTRAQRMRG